MRALSRNRIIAAMIALVVFIAALCTYSSNVDAFNMSRDYCVFDAQTDGDSIREYTLDELSEVDNSRMIYGQDDREYDPSNNGVVYIRSEYGHGTGFIIGDHLIATAAHCLYDNDEGAGSIINIYLMNSIGTRIANATPVEYHIPLLYMDINAPGTENQPLLDYALITVEEDLSSYPHFNLGIALNSIESSNVEVKTTGFPAEVNGQIVNGFGIIPMIFTSSGNIIGIDPVSIDVNNDNSGGDSGSPLYIEESRNGNNYKTAIAILSAETYDRETNEPIGNTAWRITTDELHFYYNNSNLIFTREE